MKWLIHITLITTLFSSCSSEEIFKSEASYNAALNNTDYGLVKTKTVNGIIMSVRYLPTDLLVLRELNNRTTVSQAELDSLRQQYVNSKTFVLTLTPDTNQTKADLMFGGVGSKEEYQEKVLKLNFGMDQYTSLHSLNAEYTPVLTNMENIYGLKASRDFNIVFVPRSVDEKLDYESSESLKFVFDDPYFKTGLNQFVFTKDDMTSSPGFTFNIVD